MTREPSDSVAYIASCRSDGGIFRFTCRAGGELSFIDKTPADRPMYLAIRNDTVYALLRAPFPGSDESGLATFNIEKGRGLIPYGEIVPTGGLVACHLTVSGADRIFCANYLSGSVVKIGGPLVVHHPDAESRRRALVHPTRQEAPHVHNAVLTPDGKYVCAVDLGLDEIRVYDLDLRPVSSASVPAGHGARHIVFAPDGRTAFCVNELRSTVTAFHYADGHLTVRDTYRALPEEFRGESIAAAIQFSADGRFLYVSNRGHDSITRFRVRGDALEFLDTTSCGGSYPRDFAIGCGGTRLLCCNERSDTVTALQIDTATGELSRPDVAFLIPAPVSVQFRPQAAADF